MCVAAESKCCWPEIGFTHDALATPQRMLPLTVQQEQSPQQQASGPKTSPWAAHPVAHYPQQDPSSYIYFMLRQLLLQPIVTDATILTNLEQYLVAISFLASK